MGRDFKNIKAWQTADRLTQKIYSLTKYFPNDERFGITSQLRRASVSVPTNIAEGCERNTKKDYLQFLYIARGSLSETEYLLHLSRQLKYLKEKDYIEIERDRKECGKILSGLIAFMQNNR